MKLQNGCIGALCAIVLVSAARAGVTFSFAADSNDDGPEFMGQSSEALPFNIALDGGNLDASGAVVVDLLVDVNGAQPGGGTIFNSIFDFSSVTTGYSLIPFGNGFAHHWVMNGSFSFTEVGSGLEVLRIEFNQALLASFSNSSELLASSATLQSSESLDVGLSFIPGAPLLNLGITSADLVASEAFSFALSDIEAIGESTPPAIGDGGNWLQAWQGDASFSASAGAIPSPGALALLILSLTVGWRGRRRLAA